MFAKVISIVGETLDYRCDNGLYLGKYRLIDIQLPDGVENVSFGGNFLTEIIIPNSVKMLNCENNKITKLNLPEGLKHLNCRGNPLTELVLPSTIEELIVDKNLIDLEKINKNVKVIIRYI